MAALSKEIESSRQEAKKLPSNCIIKRIPRLPPLYGSTRKSKMTFDLVTASYVLYEIPDRQERRRIIYQLWKNCSDIFILIEPGTPVGSAIIQEARTMLLEYERKREKKRRALLISNVDDDVDRIIPRLQDETGIHVLAPCPHDGPCPMMDKNMWCHFSQRYQRTRAQRVTKINPTSKWGPRDFQDENFSYVVFKRGWRREDDREDVQISPYFYQQIKPDDPEIEWTPGKAERIHRERRFFEEGSKMEACSDTDSQTLSPVDRVIKEMEESITTTAVQQSMSRISPSLIDSSVQYPEHRSQIKHTDWSLLDPRGLESSRSAATRWSRIIRKPRRRGGHVILDICSRCPSDHNGICKGQLQRQIIAQSDRKDSIGDAGYFMAKKARWGDLWPTYYSKTSKTIDEDKDE